ncbi:MAG: hypothetical protein HY927_02455 [Elusimicrobia bacterium]|nr:hypothetical protein [Elusimicrobiota bacterium]
MGSGGGKRDSLMEIVVPGALLAVLGLLFLAIWVWDGYNNEFKPRFVYEEAECRVLAKSFVPASSQEPAGLGYPVFDFEVLARGSSCRARGYDLWREGITRAKASEILSSFNVEKLHPCWFDPADPTRAVLARTHNGYWILCGAFIVLPLNALGFAMLVFARWFARGRPALSPRR